MRLSWPSPFPIFWSTGRFAVGTVCPEVPVPAGVELLLLPPLLPQPAATTAAAAAACSPAAAGCAGPGTAIIRPLYHGPAGTRNARQSRPERLAAGRVP